MEIIYTHQAYRIWQAYESMLETFCRIYNKNQVVVMETRENSMIHLEGNAIAIREHIEPIFYIIGENGGYTAQGIESSIKEFEKKQPKLTILK